MTFCAAFVSHRPFAGRHLHVRGHSGVALEEGHRIPGQFSDRIDDGEIAAHLGFPLEQVPVADRPGSRMLFVQERLPMARSPASFSRAVVMTLLLNDPYRRKSDGHDDQQKNKHERENLHFQIELHIHFPL
jgi:hypothetical protein